MAPSYLAQQRRNRAQPDDNFRKRYDPMADAMAALDDIDDQAYARQKDADESLEKKQKYAAEVSLKSNQFAEKQAAHDDAMALKEEELQARTLKERELERQRSLDDIHAQMEAGPSADDYAKQAAAAGLPSEPRGARMRAGGMRKDDIAAKAEEMGISPSSMMDEIQGIDERLKGERQDKELKRSKTESEIAENNAQAEKARKGPDPREASRKANKDILTELQIQKTRQELGEGGKPLTPTETEDVVVLENALASLRDVSRMKTGKDGGTAVDTGPISSVIGFLRSKVGAGDPRMVEFKSKVGSQLADYIKSISGATVGDKERAALLGNVPTVDDDDEEFMAKLKAVKDRLEQLRNTKRKVYEATGKDVRGIPAAKSKPRAPKKAKPMSESEMQDLILGK